MVRKLNNLKEHIRYFQRNGVYVIANLINNNLYIGSCAGKEFIYKRLKQHVLYLVKGSHQNDYLQRSFNKHGIENFEVYILETCTPSECIEKEQFWINLVKPSYNICKKAGSTFGRTFSEESKIKMSESHKRRWQENPQLREEMSRLHKGKKLGEKEKKGLELGRISKSLETRIKMSKARKEYWKKRKEVVNV